MKTEQLVAGAVAYNAPPLPPNPPVNMVQQGHQAATIQLGEPRQPAAKEEAFLPPRGFVPMIQRGRPTNKVQRKRAREVFHAEHADGWCVVDDDNYNQSVGNPKRKV
jgi:hypothetical protein